MSPFAAGAGVRLHYVSSGNQAPLCLIHGIGGHSLTSDQQAALAARTRLISFERRGYGQSEAPDPYVATTVAEQSADVAALLGELDAAPALLVGFGFGALIALDLCLRRSELVAGAVLSDPPLYAFDQQGSRELAEQRQAIEQALLAGDRSAAITALVGPSLDDELPADAEADNGACFADYAGLASLPLTRRQLRECDTPIRIVVTAAASPVLARVAAELDGLLADSALQPDRDVVGAAESLLS